MPPSMNSPTTPSLSTASHNDTAGLSMNEARPTTQKRNRVQLSCTNCRHAKLKCDRKEPCSQCVKKGKDSQCTFPRPAPRRKPAVSMQNRLKHLESLVKGAMSGQTPIDNRNIRNSSSPGSDLQGDNQSRDTRTTSPEAPETSTGRVLMDESETTYVGATHWAAILEDIEEVKSYFYEEVDTNEEDDDWPTAALSFDIESPATKSELLAALPSRLVVDQLVSRYFNSNSPTLHIFHAPTFQKEYQHFWEDQNGTPTAWLALLYAILVIATCVTIGTGEKFLDDRGSPMDMIKSYRQCSVQALVLSHYTKPGPYTLESFMIHLEGVFLASNVDQVQCYLLIGNAVRLALRMGLHRDSSKIGGRITPFQGEMRRRMWHHMKQIDLLASLHIGLPSMMQSIDSDTFYPSNLRDDDIDENMIELPPSRPDSELTPISYMITKSRICDIACRISSIANLLTLPTYAEVMKLDSQLMKAHSQIPHFFQMPTSGIIPITDKPERIVKRFSIELLFQKSRCMLHRKYLIKGKEDSRFAYSTDAGLDASLKLLRIQALAHETCLPGGLLARDRWFQSALSMHDFLLAAMIVYLSVIRNLGMDNNLEGGKGLTSEQKETIAALEESYRIWTHSTTLSADAKRASAVLKIMLKKVNMAIVRSVSDPNTIFHDTMDRCQDYTAHMLSSDLHTNLSMSGDSLSSGSSSVFPPENWPTTTNSNPSPLSGRELPLDIDLSFLPMESWGEMAAVPSDFSWELFDNHIRPQQFNDQIWPDISEDFGVANVDYYNYDLN